MTDNLGFARAFKDTYRAEIKKEGGFGGGGTGGGGTSASF